MQVTALGMIETIGLVSSIEAADAGLKAADVRLLGTDYVRGGLVMVRFEGEVAAVQSAVDAGAMAAQRIGKVLSAHVIPRAMPEVFCMLASDPSVGPAKRHQGGCASCGGCEGGRREAMALQRQMEKAQEKAQEKPEKPDSGVKKAEPLKSQTPSVKQTPERPAHAGDYESWRVVDLRKHARKLPGFPMTPNEIRYSNKAQLLEALAAYYGDRK